jgi:hypothetical protein
MNLRETLISGKKLTYNSPLRKELYEYLKNYDFITYNEAVFIYINNLKEIPKCPFSNNNQYFDRDHYVGCSKEYFNFIKHDIHVKSKWLSWENLFKIGLSLEEAKKLKYDKKLLFSRLKFPFIFYDKNKIKEKLLIDGFLNNVIDNLLNYDVNNINNVLSFITNIKILYGTKNNTLQYYLNRGYTEQLSKEKLYNFLNTWDKFKNIDKESERYKKWLDTRRIGLNKTRKSLRSKFEKLIYENLKNEYNIILNFSTNVDNPLFSKSKFKHDFLFNDKLIVEYNGTYWHKDMFTDKRFSNIDEYKLELIRAKICIEKHNIKYLIIWENDVKYDIKIVKDHIDRSLQDDKLFYSSRDIDVNLYNSI